MEKEMSEEPRRKWDRYSAEFRQQALERMKTCDNVKTLAKELGVARQQLHWWKQRAEQRTNPRVDAIARRIEHPANVRDGNGQSSQLLPQLGEQGSHRSGDGTTRRHPAG